MAEVGDDPLFHIQKPYAAKCNHPEVVQGNSLQGEVVV